MPAPSSLTIATNSVRRLLKEEASYHTELADQERQVGQLAEKVEAGQASEDGNDEFMLKQQKQALEQTQAVLGTLKDRISEAVNKLEAQIKQVEEGSEGTAATAQEEVQKGKEVLSEAGAERDTKN